MRPNLDWGQGQDDDIECGGKFGSREAFNHNSDGVWIPIYKSVWWVLALPFIATWAYDWVTDWFRL